jgi:predicted phage baseplate assembly protein
VPLPAPNLDTRRWADIVEDLRALVPRYTPEWTDLSDSDPGVTLFQLYAWMTEGTLYRLNQVPDLLYVKFLELLGITLRPASPASAHLTFTPVNPPPAFVVPVPRRARVAATGGTDGRPVVFETEAALQVLGAPLVSVIASDGFSASDVTATNDTLGGFEPFGPVARAGGALFLGFDWPGAWEDVTVSLFVALDDPVVPAAVQCGPRELLPVPPATIAWEAWNGRRYAPVGVDRDDTRAFTRSGQVVLRLRGDRMDRVRLAPDNTERYRVRARVERSRYDRAPRVLAIRTNTVAATQAETVENEFLGRSTGLPNQTVQVFTAPVLGDTLELFVDEGTGAERWREVDDFNGSTAESLHYTLDRATGTVTFGDGRRGHIPVATATGEGIVARQYRVGGGAAGNLPAGTITQLQTTVAGIERVTNIRPSADGRDAGTVDDARRAATGLLKSRSRAVTVEDFEMMATAAPGANVARAIVRPLHHPSFPGVAVPGAVTVVVIPDVPGPRPMPGEASLLNVCRQLDGCRLLTTELHVIAPSYRHVEVRARVLAGAAGDLGLIARQVGDHLDTFFHPLRGGTDGAGWPLGGDIFYSVVYKTVLDVEHVARIDELTIVVDGEEHEFCHDVRIDADALLWADGHAIEVAYA